MAFVAKQHLHHDQFGFLVLDERSGRCLGGFGANYYRPWVFPLYTPQGRTVIQEFPFDHPFHNGLWVAQGPVELEGRPVHFWPAPPERRPGESLFTHMGRMECLGLPKVETGEEGVRFTLRLTWRAGDGAPVLDEQRTVALYALDDATVCDVTSAKTAAYGALTYPATKFGSVCVRVEPRLTPAAGGVVMADGGRRGKADEVAMQQPCDWVAYEGTTGGDGRFGILLAVPGQRSADWFVRDYGMAVYNPTFSRPLHSAAGETWTVGLRVVAYDDPLTDERARRWLA
ncbi:MAG TPA: DUF6807 family protein [Caldilineaceae bacterium]|nr:DUF6807 family protein [Caldilineaceae bacterium]